MSIQGPFLGDLFTDYLIFLLMMYLKFFKISSDVKLKVKYILYLISSLTLIFCCCVSRSWFGVHDPRGGGVHSPGRHPYRPRPVPTLAFCLRLSSLSASRSWILTTFQMGSLSTRSGLRWLISPRPHFAEPHGLCSAIVLVGVALSFP